jgi:hypothetical protein
VVETRDALHHPGRAQGAAPDPARTRDRGLDACAHQQKSHLCIVDEDGNMVLDGDPDSSAKGWTAKRADLQLAVDGANAMFSLGHLLTMHKAAVLAQEHCGHKGLCYVDIRMAIEARIKLALSRGQERELGYEDERMYLAKLRKEGTVR